VWQALTLWEGRVGRFSASSYALRRLRACHTPNFPETAAVHDEYGELRSAVSEFGLHGREAVRYATREHPFGLFRGGR
jgi:hypothetical protein